MRSILTALSLLLVSGTAQAQQTPSQYCASQPATTCEVLNVDTYVAALTSSTTSMYFTIKQCRAGKFEAYVLTSQIYAGGGPTYPNMISLFRYPTGIASPYGGAERYTAAQQTSLISTATPGYASIWSSATGNLAATCVTPP